MKAARPQQPSQQQVGRLCPEQVTGQTGQANWGQGGAAQKAGALHGMKWRRSSSVELEWVLPAC